MAPLGTLSAAWDGAARCWSFGGGAELAIAGDGFVDIARIVRVPFERRGVQDPSTPDEPKPPQMAKYLVASECRSRTPHHGEE